MTLQTLGVNIGKELGILLGVNTEGNLVEGGHKTVFEECLLETSLMSGSWTEEIVGYMREMTDSMSRSVLALPLCMTLVLSLSNNPT